MVTIFVIKLLISYYNFFNILVLILQYRYVPESIRWLQTQNRIEEMTKILSKVAKSNGKVLPDGIEETLTLSANIQLQNNVLKLYLY